MSDVHAPRREPAPPDGVLDLDAVADDLLGQAGQMDSGRAARTLTPGAHAQLKQTLLALLEGRRLDEHRAPGNATLQVLRGVVTLREGEREMTLEAGQWTRIPEDPHDLSAEEDAVVLLTVVGPPGDDVAGGQ